MFWACERCPFSLTALHHLVFSSRPNSPEAQNFGSAVFLLRVADYFSLSIAFKKQKADTCDFLFGWTRCHSVLGVLLAFYVDLVKDHN